MQKLFLFFSLSLVLTSLVLAANYDHTISTETLFSINTKDAERKFEDTVFNPEAILNTFNPAGVTVLKKIINGNEFEYEVEKRILGIRKKFHLIGSLSFERTNSGCSNNTSAYLAHLDLSQSGPDITDTVSDFTLLICNTNQNHALINGKSKNTLYYKGEKFGILLDQIAKKLINDQVNELFSSIKKEISKKSH